MILSKQTLKDIKTVEGAGIASEQLFLLPEKVLQFGTGVLLRGLPDYFIDKANRQGFFGGRVVLVKSTTAGGDTAEFIKQDCLYTQCIRGIENGKRVEETVINASISRVLTANEQWDEVLACAASDHLKVILSNTTEVGIALLNNDNIYAAPPVSFPGKLLAFLRQRYTVFNGSLHSGLIIIPTELIVDNGTKLKSIVVELAKQNHLEEAFINWIGEANDFCNSLVDRIVPGGLPAEEKTATESSLGYTDNLIIMSEVYRLWAIETVNERTKKILSFSQADQGVVITDDIERYRELKLRLLNGSHTFSCALAVQMGFTTVKQAMDDDLFCRFISCLMLEEIVPAIVTGAISEETATQFAFAVLERYRNPFIEHRWQNISLQYSSKMKLRNVPVLLQYYEKKDTVPRYMALGFAAYLLFMKSEQHEQEFMGNAGGQRYLINDDSAAELHRLWYNSNTNNFVLQVLEDTNLWQTNLDDLPGFRTTVTAHIEAIQKHGIVHTLQQFLVQQSM